MGVQVWWKRNCRCEAVMTMSALQGQGVPAVKDWMVEQLPEGPTLYPKRLVSQHPERFFISEIVREHVFRRYSQEIPYSVQARPGACSMHLLACMRSPEARFRHTGHTASPTACFQA